MKKIYALAAVAFMAATAFAQNGAPLYICGGGENLGWEPAAPAEFTFADGKYTFESTKLAQFKISTTVGEGWDEFNEGALGCGEAGYGDVPGVAVPLVPWGENIECPWAGDYTITVAGDLSTITLTTNTPKPEEDYAVLYFKGDMNGWGGSEEWKLTYLGDNIYTFTCEDGLTITTADGWKISTDPWNDKYNYGAPDLVLFDIDNEMECAGTSPNSTLAEDWNGVAYLKIGEPGEGAVLFMSNDKEAMPDWVSAVSEIASENDAPATYYNLQGVRVANPENGLFIVVKGNKTFKTIVK